MIRMFAAAGLCALMALPALADEVWALPSGNQVIYDRDVGTTAIFSYAPEIGLEKGWIFVPGLAGVYEGRGTYSGFWVEPEGTGPTCPAALVDAEGNTWTRWGAMDVKFAKPTFPSRIELKRGNCFGSARVKLTAKPVIGVGLQ